MSGFNFGLIGNIMSELFDSDLIDIKRDVGNELQEIYSNVRCHIAFSSTDNPDPTTVDTRPIIQSINVHMPLWVDIQNNDFIIAKRMDNNGNLLKTYSGRCGNPIVSEGRQKVLMIMSATDSSQPTPIPPKNPSIIKINYLSDNGTKIQDSVEKVVEVGSSFNITAPSIEGYSVEYCLMDGVKQETSVIYINSVSESGAVIDFIYKESEIPNKLRFLINGLYTRDDGSLANGYHVYKKIDIDSITTDNDTFIITCEDVNWIHEDNEKLLSIKPGVKLVLTPQKIFIRVTNINEIQNGKITFEAVRFTPTENENNYYNTEWYD